MLASSLGSASGRLSRWGARATALIAIFAAVVAGMMLIESPTAEAQPPPPQEDPFYQPPDGFADTAPGTVLRSREVQLAVLTVLPLKVESWQLLYRTTDLFGNADTTVTTVLLPAGAQRDPNRPLLSHQAFYDSSNPACGPSYVLRQGTGMAGVEGMHITTELQNIAGALQQGWAVSVPDHEGRQGHLAVAREPGYMVLDGIRAAQQFTPLGLHADSEVALWGFSGGGMATGWTVEMAPTYAPELNIVGAAMGAPTPDIRSLVHLNGSGFSSLVGIGIASLANAYPRFGAAVRAHMTPEGQALMAKTRSQCLIRNAATNLFVDYERYLTLPIDEFLALPEVKETFDQTILGGNAPTTPLFVYQGVYDEAVPWFTTDKMVRQYCAAGASVTYKRDHASEHLTLPALGMYDAFTWLKERLNTDNPVSAGCSTRDVASMLAEPGVPQSILDITTATGVGVVGLPVGPN